MRYNAAIEDLEADPNGLSYTLKGDEYISLRLLD